jgi:hypothetical protein
VQPLGGPGDAAGFGERSQTSQFSQTHVRSLAKSE